MALLEPPTHVDDLAPFHRQHRLIGLGVLLGGLAGGLVWASTAWLAWGWGAVAWAAAMVLGVVYMTLGAGWAQQRAARRMMAPKP